MTSRWPQHATLRGLYLITPDDADSTRLQRRVQAVLAQARLLQYRNKAADVRLRRMQVAMLLPLCRNAGVPLIVNDDWRLAAELGADGAHLGRDDGNLPQARAALGPDAILGVSCYDEIGRARNAAAQGASYVAFGAFFPSSTKPDARCADTALLQQAASLQLPIVAIGGITPDNAPSLIKAGADMVAVISGVFDAPGPAVAARAYSRCFLHPHPSPAPR